MNMFKKYLLTALILAGIAGAGYASQPFFGGVISITNVVPGFKTFNIGKQDNGAYTQGSDVGVAPLAVRQDTMGAKATLTGQYQALDVDNQGRLREITQLTAGDGATPASTLGPTNTGTTDLAASHVLVGTIQACNSDAQVNYVKGYDKATAATSADTPIIRIAVPVGTCVNFGIHGTGYKLVNGLSWRAVQGIADNNTTGAASGTVAVNYSYF